MKISEINEDNIAVVIQFNHYEKPGEIARQHPNLIPKILEHCRIGEYANVLAYVPNEEMALQIVKQKFIFANFLAIKFPDAAVKMANIITNSDRPEIELNAFIPHLTPRIVLDILKNIPKYAIHILKLRNDLEKEAEKIFKLEE